MVDLLIRALTTHSTATGVLQHAMWAASNLIAAVGSPEPAHRMLELNGAHLVVNLLHSAAQEPAVLEEGLALLCGLAGVALASRHRLSAPLAGTEYGKQALLESGAMEVAVQASTSSILAFVAAPHPEWCIWVQAMNDHRELAGLQREGCAVLINLATAGTCRPQGVLEAEAADVPQGLRCKPWHIRQGRCAP